MKLVPTGHVSSKPVDYQKPDGDRQITKTFFIVEADFEGDPRENPVEQRNYSVTMPEGKDGNESDFFDAEKTNGHADCVINANDLPMVKEDFESYGFKDVEFRLVDVASLYPNLEGEYHAPYWASHWLFVYGKK